MDPFLRTALASVLAIAVGLVVIWFLDWRTRRS